MMNLIQASEARHTVRHYDGKPLTADDKNTLLAFIKELNAKSGLNMQLIVNEPKAFGGPRAAISNFTGCVNYIAVIGDKTPKFPEIAGYYGEQVVLKAQQMGLNTCWAVTTYDSIPDKYIVGANQALLCLIAIGYGTTQGKPHPCKSFDDVVVSKGTLPEWFIQGVKIALNAPTGKNVQGFKFELLENNVVRLINNSYSQDIDVGILKYHFELGAGHSNWRWEK